MKVSELLCEGLVEGALRKAARELQAALDKKGANLAKVKIVTLKDGSEFIEVKHNTAGGVLARNAVRSVIDDYMLPRYAKGNFFGINYILSYYRPAYQIFLSRPTVNEGTVDNLTVNLMKFLRAQFDPADEVMFALERIFALRDLLKLPDDTTECIRAVTLERTHSQVLERINALVKKRFPDGNVLGVTVRVIEVIDGALIVLKQDINEAVSPGRAAMSKKVADRIKTILDSIAYDLRKELQDMAADGERVPTPFTVAVHMPPTGYDGISVMMSKNPNISDTVWDTVEDIAKDALEEEGYLSGIIPLDITFKFLPNYAAVVIR